MSLKLAESENFIITNEYEKAFLIFKDSNRKANIGDFYGDPQTAIISNDERFCAVGGCGIIVYYLHEPYEEYRYNVTTIQWKELYRENKKNWWIQDIKFLDSSTIIFTVENTDIDNGGRYRLNINTFELTRCN
ncbi:MAG TPA: hypothetical protein DEP72_01040 [Clostridiales bacterium]|nr:hypothetical protein [Clostridiales bacterium]